MYHLPLVRVHITTRSWIFSSILSFNLRLQIEISFSIFFSSSSIINQYWSSPLLHFYTAVGYLGDPSDSSFFPLILHIFNSSHLSIVVPLSIFFFDYDSIQESVSVWRAYPCLSVLSFELLLLRGPIS